MPTIQSVMDDLKSCGKESYLKTYVRHGIPPDRTFGVSNADLKLIAKKLKGEQELAMELYATGNYDAMYLAGIVVDGSKMTRAQLQDWADGVNGIVTIANYPVAWAATENKEGWNLALEWINSDDEMTQCAGWSTLCGIATTTADANLDIEKLSELVDEVCRCIHSSKNRTRSAMNSFVITVGTYVMPLNPKAKEAANAIGIVTVDVGDTDCKIPVSSAVISKAEAAGKVGIKRKTIRC